MSTNPVKFDFGAAADTAARIASEKDAEASQLLWGHIATRAVSDDTFRRELTQNPESAITREAGRLNVSLKPEDLAKAKEIFSPAIPGSTPEKVEQLIFGTIEDVRKSFNLTLRLAQILFGVGLAMLVVSLIFSITRGKDSSTIVFGAGGVASLIASLVMNPLDRIRNAGANLVQIQMAYLAYYKQLYLLGARQEFLTPADASLFAKELRETAVSMVGAIQSVLERPVSASSSKTSPSRRQPAGSAAPAMEKPALPHTKSKEKTDLTGTEKQE
jgi:hypothetical protein